MMIMEVSIASSCNDDKKVPWRYECNLVSSRSLNRQEPSTNITRVATSLAMEDATSRMKRKNKMIKKKKQNNLKWLRNEKPSTVEPKNAVNEKDDGEFLKLIKHNKFSIVELLNKQLKFRSCLYY